MNTRFIKFIGFVCVALAMTFSIAVNAGSADIKKRMGQRLGSINSFKVKGIIGEANTGYLKLLKEDKAAKALVEAENKDRKTIYQVIGKKNGISADAVGKRRALTLFKLAAKGTMVQNTAGKWIKK